MKKLLITLTVAATLLVGTASAASAQETGWTTGPIGQPMYCEWGYDELAATGYSYWCTTTDGETWTRFSPYWRSAPFGG